MSTPPARPTLRITRTAAPAKSARPPRPAQASTPPHKTAPKAAPTRVPAPSPAHSTTAATASSTATARAPTGRIPAGQTNTAAHGPDGTVRLNKHMADLGLASRREADAWIANGWVRVNGAVAAMGMQVQPGVHIDIDKTAHQQQANQVTVLFNKPLGIVSGQAEDGHTPAISLIQPDTRWHEDNARYFFHPSQRKSLVPAGRLDIDSTGLLVLTQDGRVARQLIGEDSRIEKEYLVRVAYTGVLNPDAAHSPAATYPGLPRRQPPALRQLERIDDDDPITSDVQSVFPADKLQLLRHGLRLDDAPLLPARVEWQNPEQLRFVLTEGKKRQIRRMCELVGLKVVGLKRVRVGQVMLGNLPVGQWRYLQAHEKF